MADDGHIRVPNLVFDRYQKEPDKLAAWCWIERTRRYSGDSRTVSISRIAGRFSHSRNWAREIVIYWELSRGTGKSADSTDDFNRDGTGTGQGQARDGTGTPQTPDNKEDNHALGTGQGQARDRTGTGQGHHTKKQKAKSNKQLKAVEAIASFTTPEWIPRDLWEQWQQVRIGLPKATMTALSMKLAVKNLERIRSRGDDPARVLELAAQSGWRGIDSSWSSTQIPARQAPPPNVSRETDTKAIVHAGSEKWIAEFLKVLTDDDCAGLRVVWIESVSATETVIAGIPDSFWKGRLAWQLSEPLKESLVTCGELWEGAEIVLKIGVGERVQAPQDG